MAVSEAEMGKIKKEVDKILNDFGNALKKVKMVESRNNVIKESVRVEGEGVKLNEDFRKRIFANSIEKDENHIYAEKKKW